MTIRLFTGPGTRRWPRFNMAAVRALKGIRSCAGSEVQVENISREGALLHTRKRVAPGTRIQLRLVTVEGEIPLVGLVLRSSLSSEKGAQRYRAAVAFDSPLLLLDGEPATDSGVSQVTALRSPCFSRFSCENDRWMDNPIHDVDPMPGFLECGAGSIPDAALYETFKLNNW